MRRRSVFAGVPTQERRNEKTVSIMKMNETTCNRLMKTGIVSTVIVAICCFTPALVILFGAVGLGAITGYLDYVLFPALGFFIILTIYAIMKRKNLTCTTQKQ